jgi:hypothetical protein
LPGNTPDLHRAVKALPEEAAEIQERDTVARTLSFVLGDIENACLMAAAAYVETSGLHVATFMFDGFMAKDPEGRISAEDMSDRVFEATGYRIQFERKSLDASIKAFETLNHEIVALKVVEAIKRRVLMCNDLLFAYNALHGLRRQNTKPSLIVQMAIQGWITSRKVFHGFNPTTYRPTAIDLGNTTDMNAMASQARTQIPLDDLFLTTKHKTAFRKIKFEDCVYHVVATGEAHRVFRPEKFLVHVPRGLPERIDADVANARAIVQDLFTFREAEPAPRTDYYDFEATPLWQFVLLAIGAAIAGDVDLKLMYAMIGQRKSGKGMLMTVITVAFGNLVDAGNSADNLLGSDNNQDEAKKCKWLTDAAIKGARLLWKNEVRTHNSRGEPYIDGNLLKKIASGGDSLPVRNNCENPYPVRHEFTVFLNVNDLPPVRPAIGETFLRIRFPNQYVDEPTLPNHKRKDDGLKGRIAEPSFADGMMWLVLYEYKSFFASGKAFKAIPEVLTETAAANEAEGEELIEALSALFQFAAPFSTIEECERSGFLIKPAAIKDALEILKRTGRLQGVSKSGLLTQLSLKGYPRYHKLRYDPGNGVCNIIWIVGIRERPAAPEAGTRGPMFVGDDSDLFLVPLFRFARVRSPSPALFA